MFSIDGNFGKIRRIQFPPDIHTSQSPSVPFQFLDGGWHKCNDIYAIKRENGKDGHLLLFSLNDGGMLGIDHMPHMQIPASSVVWIPPHRKHTYYTAPGKIWEFYWLDIAESSYIQFDHLFDNQFVLPLGNMDSICSEFEQLFRRRSKTLQEYQIESSRMIGNIYHSLLEQTFLQTKTKKHDSLVHSIIGKMEQDCSKNQDLAELSKLHFISVPQLIRRFKLETGMTPYAYLTMIRLQSAETFLKHTNYSVSEIGRLTGFPNTSNFIRQFSKLYGMTPYKYRSSR